MSATRTAKAQSRPFGEHECVRLLKGIRKAGLTKSSVGSIVHIYPDGETYEVEFSDAKAGYEVMTLNAASLRAATADKKK